ncbi:hypothetical protein HOLleu_32746 [Holothuria leucospilota]|uniref:Uncharacterized protein n=1 Tax=Holothuria leucospilota TaxID=206669 RepID=A0A9Q1BJ63_HOLLE|nr:hypothetical protein HOLleu_32746 [Holothuria leucospilota]
MAAAGPLVICKVVNSSPMLAKLKKHHDHSLVPFTCGDFACLCIARGGENSHQKSKIFACFMRIAHLNQYL